MNTLTTAPQRHISTIHFRSLHTDWTNTLVSCHPCTATTATTINCYHHHRKPITASGSTQTCSIITRQQRRPIMKGTQWITRRWRRRRRRRGRRRRQQGARVWGTLPSLHLAITISADKTGFFRGYSCLGSCILFFLFFLLTDMFSSILGLSWAQMTTNVVWALGKSFYNFFYHYC